MRVLRHLSLPTSILSVTCLIGTAWSQTSRPASPTEEAAAGSAESWSQWRGPARSGHTRGPAWPARLETKSLRQQWRIAAGPSYSGPVVDSRHVYTTATIDRRDEEVTALDRHTGKIVWQVRWKGATRVPFFAAKNGSWIRATPALDDSSIYVCGMRDLLVCLDKATGKERWRVDFTKTFGTPVQTFGFVSSPLLHQGHVYVQTAAGLIKLAATTGKTVWRGLVETGGMMGGAFSSPIVTELAGQTQLVAQTRSHLCGVAVATGKTLWKMPVRSFRGMNILTPQPYDNGIFTTSYGGRGHLFTVDKTEAGCSATRKWQSRVQGYMTSPVVIEGHAYLYLRSKRFACVNLETGELTWTSPPIGDDYCSLIANGNRILALTSEGDLCLLAANPDEYELLGRVAVSDESTWAHLAFDRGQLFIRELKGLVAFRLAAPAGKKTDSAPAAGSKPQRRILLR